MQTIDKGRGVGEVEGSCRFGYQHQYGLGVRNDLMNAETQKQQCGWKGLRAASLA